MNGQSQQAKIVHIALDDLPEGNDAMGLEPAGKKDLPRGITSSMLYQDVVRIAWPSFMELMLTQLTSMVDLIMVGALGTWALTSVGLSHQPRLAAMCILLALNVGTTAVIARCRGMGDRLSAQRAMRQALMIIFLVSCACGIVGYLGAQWFIAFMGASEAQTLAGGTVYLQIQMLGLPTVALTSAVTAGLRGVGNSRTAMIYNIIANVVNVVGNFLLIEGRFGFPRLEVAGASLATVMGQVVALMLALRAITRKNQYLRVRLRDGFRPDMEIIRRMMKVGIPAMVENLLMRVGVIIYAKMVNSLGTDATAIHQVCMNIEALTFTNGQAFAVSATALVGQSLGKKRPDMAQHYAGRTQRIGMCVSLAVGLLFLFAGTQVAGLYSDDVYVISQAARVLKILALVQPLLSTQFILAGALRGAGDTKSTAIVSLLTVLTLRPILAAVMIYVFHLGIFGAWIAMAIEQTVRSGLTIYFYRTGRWKKIKV